MKVDKTFLYCHSWEEKDKLILIALYLSLYILPEKDFPGQITFVKFISRGTVLFSHIFTRFYPGVPERKITIMTICVIFLNNSRNWS